MNLRVKDGEQHPKHFSASASWVEKEKQDFLNAGFYCYHVDPDSLLLVFFFFDSLFECSYVNLTFFFIFL